MSINVAIHLRTGSFSDRWIKYCSENKINFKIVNCYDSDIIEKLRDCDVLLWHWWHQEASAQLSARQIIFSIEQMGIKVFPNFNSCWHFDDKIGQKYLLEAIQIPLVPTYIFYEKQKALDWIEIVSFPKVFKLRGGAGSLNVKLVRNNKEAKKLVNRAFNQGFISSTRYFNDAKTKIKKIKNFSDFLNKLSRLPQSLRFDLNGKKFIPVQRGYIYFQDFLPGNTIDTRITIIGNRAFGTTRGVRENDFRASGGVKKSFDKDLIDLRFIKIAFEVSKKLNTQSLAFDFILNVENEPKVTEISYCYPSISISGCPGYWDENLIWHSGQVLPEDAIIQDMLNYQHQLKKESN